MPVSLVDRLPLPSLKVYSAGSVVLLSIALYTAVNVTSDPNWRANATLHKQEPPAGAALNQTNNVTDQFVEVMTFMLQEPLCMWTLINMAYCSLALFGFFIQRLVFGKLRVAEAQRVKDKFWNYVFYKFIFVFGVLNVQYMDEVLLWCSWFTLVGFLHLLGQLCKDRFDYLSSAPSAGSWAQTRLLGLLVGILCAASALMAVAFAWGLPAGKDTFAFMAAECLLVGLSVMHVLARFALRAHDADAAGPAAYYTHLAFDAGGLITETCHVAHMVVYSNVVVSMASVVLLMHLRHLLHALLARLQRHRLYSALADHMSRNYPMASAEEVRKNEDNCAICWEPMKEARKLPCAHLFHNSCLCRWVQQDASCPTCRRSLSAGPEPPQSLAPLVALPPLPQDQRLDGRANHLFHFDGSRYVSWLPSFSVEVTRVRDNPAIAPPVVGAPLLEAMAAQVQQLFPQYPRALLLADLTLSRSPDLTIDNILEGRLPPPPPTAAIANPAPEVPSAQQASSNTTPDMMQPSSSNDDQLENDEGNAQFSSTAPEREAMLKRRKEALLATARRRYLERLAAAPISAAASSSSSAPARSGETPRS